MSRFERRAAALFFERAFPDLLSWSLSSALARAGAFIADRIVRLCVLVSHLVYDEGEGEGWAFNLYPRHKS
jgi:hypothetical protein